MAECDGVHRWLQQRWKIASPRDWLEACIDWIHSEQQGLRISNTDLCNLVFEQWLLCDLRDVGAQCLPPNCTQQPKIVLNDHFCLQVNSVLDVSQPYYGQLQKVQGTENANVHVSATQFTQTPEVKAGRMLMFDMTDGVQTIRGMEYQPLVGFDVSMTPGTKVIIEGPVLCRQGVLMLKKDNISLLGGEVDTLVEQNTQLALIQRTLMEQTQNQTVREIPKKKFSGKIISKPTQDQSKSQKTNQQTHVQSFSSSYKKQQVNQTTTNFRSQSIQRNSSSVSVNQGSATISMEDDDFLEHLDPAELDVLEQQPLLQSVQPRRASNVRHDVPKHVQQRLQQPDRNVQSNVNEWGDEDDDDLLFEQMDVEEQAGPARTAPRTPSLNYPTFSNPVTLTSNPYTYLKLVADSQPLTFHQIVKVKAYVATLVSRLEHNDGQKWSLRVKINDGTAAMDVDLSDQFLTSLIGFSAKRCNSMKEQAKSNKLVKLQIATGIKKCQQSLVDLCCMLELELSPDQDWPVVLRQLDFMEHDILALEQRNVSK